MSKKEKLVKRLLTYPKDFTYNEMSSLLNSFGFIECNNGKTSGSSVSFIHNTSKIIIRFHKPHPNSNLKRYVLEQVISILKQEGLI